MLPARYRGDRGSPDSIEDSRLSRNSTLDEIGVGKLHALLIQFLGMVGVEPTQSEDYTILSRTRIPIPPHAHLKPLSKFKSNIYQNKKFFYSFQKH